MKTNHPKPATAKKRPLRKARPAPFFLDEIFNQYRKYKNYKRYVHPDLL